MEVRRAGRADVRTIFCSRMRREWRERRVGGSRVASSDQWVKTLRRESEREDNEVQASWDSWFRKKDANSWPSRLNKVTTTGQLQLP